MKRILTALFLILAMTVCSSCDGNGNANSDLNGDGIYDEQEGGDDLNNNDNIDENVKMFGLVTENSSGGFMVDATDSEGNQIGICRILILKTTVIKDENGNRISRSDINVGDSVEIVYNGQMTRSYPPQVVALQIKTLG